MQFAILFSSPAHALKPPHAAPNINLCSDCHSRTGAGFASITSQNVLCINAIGCHSTGGRAEKKSLSLLDASNRFGNLPSINGSKQSSHGWKIPNLNQDAGVTQTNKWGELATGLGKALDNKILCTRCHRAHGEKTGYVIYDKFLRQTPTGNYICMQCHAARQISNVRDPKPDDKHYSHPVEVNYSTVRTNKPDWFYVKPLNPYSSNPSAALKLMTTVNVDGLGRITGVKGTNQVVCQTCHGPLHASDSNPYTMDNLTSYSKSGNYSTSDGNLLRRYPAKKSNDLCGSCHKVQTHRGFLCARCHAPHKKAGEQNRYLIQEVISTPNSGKRAVQFISTSHPAQRYGDSNKICQVCHTNTRYHRNYSTVSAKRDHNYLGNDTYKFCPDCHSHLRGFLSESMGNTACSTAGCHDDFFSQLNNTNGGYHHYLNNANVSILASGSKYPVLAPQPGTPHGDRSDPNRRCLQCHVEHDIFKPELNWQSPGRAYNLRFDISILPNRTAHGNNTDFVPSTSPDAPKAPNGGICLSCHQNSQFKSYTQPDNTTRTPLINKTLFEESPHQFTAPATFNNGATVFNANCSKCHIDTLNKSKQGAGTQFGPHYSNVRRIQAGSTNLNNTGTVSSATAATLTDTNIPAKNWETDIWKSFNVTILDGTGSGQTRSIAGNSADTLTLSSAWTTIPNSTSRYLINISREFDSGMVTGSTSTTITDNTKTGASAWIPNYWKERPVTIIIGTGKGQTRKITGNTGSQLTVTPSWSPLPDTTSKYSIGDPMEEELCFKCHSRQSNPYASQNKDYYGVKTFDNTKTLKMEELFNDPAKPYKHRVSNYFAKHRGDESVNAPQTATATGWLYDEGVTNGLHSGCADCHNPHGNRKPGSDNGVATGGTAGAMGPPLVGGTLIDANKNWSPDQWRGYTVRIMDGPGRGQDRLITGNTNNAITAATPFMTAPASGSYYIINPIGLPDKGNSLWQPNSGTWGVVANYTAASAKPALGSKASPVFTKKEILVGGEGSDKIYNLCFKCHSDYGWGTGGSPFTIPDSIRPLVGSNFTEGPSTNIAQEFNPNNLGYHPIIAPGQNQPITATGFNTVDIVGSSSSPLQATGGSATTVNYANNWNPNKYNGMCVEIVSGTGSGQVRSVTGHNSTGITSVDPNFSTAPNSTSAFVIRKCSSYDYGYNGNLAWPRFTGGTITVTAGNPTVTISGLINDGVRGGIPSTVIPGWYIYAGSATPSVLTSSGWFQVKTIGAGASNPTTTTTTLTVTPTPQSSYSGPYALSAGFGNTFVPPYGPWSVMSCPDCHDTDDTRDPSGPHASARNWILRLLEAQTFPWYYGGTESGDTTDPTQVKTIGYPDGNDAGWATVNTNNNTTMACWNCHRADVYTPGSVPTTGSFPNMSVRYLGRVPHPPYPATDNNSNIFGIWCMNCHGADIINGALGAMHGTNVGVGYNGSSFRGRRLLNGAIWNGVTRSATNAGGSCYYGGGGGISSGCGGSGGISAAAYPYFSGADMYLPQMTSVVASDASGGHTGIQAGDTIVIRFDGETQGNAINSSNINTALAVTGKPTGWGTIQGTAWSTTTYQNDTLTVTFGTGATIAVGDAVTPNGTIKNILGMGITNGRTVTGDFGYWLVSAQASDASGGGPGIQAGDKVVIRFNGATAGTTLDATNIDSALQLSTSHSWKDGSGAIGSAAWSTTTYTNDTLTITLSNNTSVPSVIVGDTVTLGTVIRDQSNNAITNPSIPISGTFTSIPTGAVGYWPMDEGSGYTVSDATTYGNHGTAWTGTSYGATWITGVFGKGLSFTNSAPQRWVTVPDNDSLDLTSAGTIEFWMAKSGNVNYQTYVSKRGSSGAWGYQVLDYSTTGQLQVRWGSDGEALRSTAPLSTGIWHHIVVTYGGGYLKLFIDGELDQSVAWTTNAVANTDPLYIGRRSDGYYVYSYTDNVIVYNRTLTDAEARERYRKVRSAVADDNSAGGLGIQSGDRVTITFNTATDGAVINTGNIDSALALSDGRSWGTITSAVWSDTGEGLANNRLTVTLGSSATIRVGDLITMGGTIKDGTGNQVSGTIRVAGSFGKHPSLPDGAVGYWKLDDGTSGTTPTTAADSMIYGNNGTLTNGPTWTTGRFGNGVNFDGSNDNITVPAAKSLDLGTEATVEGWVKLNVAQTRGLILKSSIYGIQLDASTSANGTIFYYGGGSVTYGMGLSTGVWYHLAGTYDGTNLKLYVNGELVNTATIKTNGSYVDGSPVYIGWGNGYLNGAADEVAIYNRALTASEVLERYGASVKYARANDASGGGYGIQAGDQVVVCFDGPTAGNAIDASNINSALTVSGKTWLDGIGGIGSASWSTKRFTNDTLTVSMSSGTAVPTVVVGDTITLGNIIKDTSNRSISGSVAIKGNFGLPANAVGYWRMEGNGNDDISGYMATPYSYYGYYKGRNGYGLKVWGNNGYMQVMNAGSTSGMNPFNLTSSGSIEFWVKKAAAAGAGGYQAYIAKGPTNPSAYGIYDYDTTGRLAVRWGSVGSNVILTTDTIPVGVWTHVAVTFDGARLKAYINGNLSADVPWTTAAPVNGDYLYFGRSSDGYNLNGSLDEIVIYDRALSGAEVQSRYGKGWFLKAEADDNSGSGFGIQSGDRVVMTFRESTNAPVIDGSNINTALALSGGHVWGTIQGAAWSQTTTMNDTLTVILGTGGTVAVGDTITLGGGTIRNVANQEISDIVGVSGTFGTSAGEPVNSLGHWKLNDGTSGSTPTSAVDSTGNGNTGTLTNGPTWTSGRFGNAVRFDGTNDYVNIPNTSVLRPASSGSIELWMKKNTNANNQTYVSFDGARRLYDSGTTGKMVFQWDSWGSVTSPAALPVGMWHHVVGTYDGTDLKLYVNGQLVVSAQYSSDMPPGTSATNTIGSGAAYANGIIDDVVEYNRVLTASEIQDRFIVGLRDARSYDNSLGGSAVQTGDRAVIRFNGPTNGPVITAGNIDTALRLNGGTHTWLDGNGQIGSAAWSSELYSNDTLTIVTSGNGLSIAYPTVAGGDVITTTGSIIKDSLGRDISDSTTILGNFDVAPDTFGYYRLDETGGTTAYDSSVTASVTNSNGTVNGASGWSWTTGLFGNSISFNGVSDSYISYPSNTLYTLSGDYTLEAFVKPAAWPVQGDGAVLFNAGAYFLYNLAVYDDGKIGFSYNPTGQFIGRTTVKSNSPLILNEWNHIILTRSGSTATFYINGEESGSFTDSHYTTNNGTLWTGKASIAPDSYYFNGQVDEIVMYSRAINTDEAKKRARTWMKVAVIARNSSGSGSSVQAGDQVEISFDGATDGPAITAGNIDSVLALNNGHTWKDGSGNIGGAVWSTSKYLNDTLTITFSVTGGVPTIVPGDTITLGATAVKDSMGRYIFGSRTLGGTFAPVPDGAVAYWKLDETGGNTVVDATGNRNNGTIYGGTTRTAGKDGSGLTFDGISGYMEAKLTNFNLANALSVELWVKAPDQVNGATLAAGESARIQAWNDISGNKVNPGVYTGSYPAGWQGSGWITGGNPFNGSWRHLVLTWDGTTQRFYTDGVLVGSATGSGTLVNNGTFRLGNALTGASWFNGSIDEVIVYNKTITAAEISARYRNISIQSAVADDNSGGGAGGQSGDRVVVKFTGATQGNSINSSNINTALALSSGHTWGTITGAAWSTSSYTNDTLTVTLGTGATIGIGDTVTLDGATIRDASANPVTGGVQVSGSFGTASGMPQGAVGYWRFNEGGGINVNDSTANGNNGNVVSGSWIPGMNGTGLSLNGTSDFAEVPDSNSLDITNSGSIEMWVKKTANNNNQVYLAKGNAYQLSEYGTTGRLVFRWGNTADTLITDTALPAGSWTHLAATYDGYFLKLYVNGILTKSVAYTNTAAANGNTLRIGANAAGNYFNGAIDEVALYNKALTTSEVLARMSARMKSAVSSDTSGIVGIQAGDKVVITFDGPTQGNAINAGNIDTALNLGGHTWKDGSGGIGSAAWSSSVYSNDTLTITLSATSGAPTVAAGDTITPGGVIKDISGQAVTGTKTVTGSFHGSIAYFKLDEGNGNVATDYISGNNGTISGAAWTAGRTGNALSFNGLSDKATTGNIASLDVANLTIEGWVNSSDYTTGNLSGTANHTVVSRHGSGTGSKGYELGVTSSGKPYLAFEDMSVNTWSKLDNTIPAASNSTSTNGRIPLGTNGTGDDAHIYNPSVIKDGSTYKMWYGGHDGANVRIYYATSPDGLTWTKYDNTAPAASNTFSTNGRVPLGTNGTGDDVHSSYQSVIKEGATYKMWYSGYDGANWRIYYATSPDGLVWTKYDNSIPASSDISSTNGRVPLGTNGKGDDAGTISPTVIKEGAIYKMWYGGYDGSIWRIYYATSPDGLTWTKYDNSIPAASDTSSTNGRIPLGSNGKGDDAHTFVPTIIKDGSTYRMWYMGGDGTNYRIYYATSSDGLSWTKFDNSIPAASDTTSSNGRLPLGTNGLGDDVHIYSASIIKEGGVYKGWYWGYDGSNWRVYYATIEAGISAPSALTPGWHHIAGTKAADGTLKLYVDTVQAAAGSTSVTGVSNASGLTIGDTFSGSIDELSVYNRELSSGEVTDRFGNP